MRFVKELAEFTGLGLSFQASNRALNIPSANGKEKVDIIAAIQESTPDFDFSALAKDLAVLPEKNPFHSQLAELSPQGNALLKKLHLIHRRNPALGLKIITVLACDFGGTLYTNNFGNSIYPTLKDWLLCSELPRQMRIDWGMFCWKNWPILYAGYSKNDLIKPLLQLLIEESCSNPEFVLDIYDSIPARGFVGDEIFCRFLEDPEDILLFARNVCHLRPQFLPHALLKLIYEGGSRTFDWSIDVAKRKSACNELFEISQKNEGIPAEFLETILRRLILDSCLDVPWYEQLHERLWRMEKDKSIQDTWSIRNHFIASINASGGRAFLLEIRESYQQWLNTYKTEAWLSIKSVVEHVDSMVEFINFSLNVEYPITRNRSCSKPNNTQLIDDTVASYWEMIAYLKARDTELYCYALEAAAEKPTFTVKLTEELGNQAQQLLIDVSGNPKVPKNSQYESVFR